MESYRRIGWIIAFLIMVGSAQAQSVLVFGSTSCGPCMAMKPSIDQLIKEGKPFNKINTDNQPELTEKYNITRQPTLIYIDKDGKEVARMVGYKRMVVLRAFLKTPKIISLAEKVK